MTERIVPMRVKVNDDAIALITEELCSFPPEYFPKIAAIIEEVLAIDFARQLERQLTTKD